MFVEIVNFNYLFKYKEVCIYMIIDIIWCYFYAVKFILYGGKFVFGFYNIFLLY